ncbi:hypothetical protein EJB05_56499, partial [Eragrostis curvula]
MSSEEGLREGHQLSEEEAATFEMAAITAAVAAAVIAVEEDSDFESDYEGDDDSDDDLPAQEDEEEEEPPYKALTGRQWMDLVLRDRNWCKRTFRMYPDEFLNLHNYLVHECGLDSSQEVESLEALGMFVWACATRQSCRGIMDTFKRSLDTISRKMAHVADVMLRFAQKVIRPKDKMYSTVSPKLSKWSPWFDGCIGAIDGTHIPLRAPKKVKEDMRNRKGWTSMNVLAIVDHEMRFTFIGAGKAGACHDMAVLKECQEDECFPHPPKGGLLPDCAAFLYEILKVGTVDAEIITVHAAGTVSAG